MGGQDYWEFGVYTMKMKKACWCYLIARRKLHLDTTVICAASREEEIKMYNTPILEALEIVKQLGEDLKKHIVIIRQNEMYTC